MKPGAVVLLSGGLDSAANLWLAHKELEIKSCLTVNYGQRAAQKEIETSRCLSDRLAVPHRVLEFPFLAELGGSALTESSRPIPTGVQVQIENLGQSQVTAKAVWVPNRNGILLNIAAALAERLDAMYVIPGFNAEEASTFPDNSEDFMKALNISFSFSTANRVRVKCYTSDWDKSRIVKEALLAGFDFSLLWPCYHAGEKWCGECESCLRAKRAFAANGLSLKERFQC